MKTYKGFDKDLKCRGFQYEIGKEYETDTAKACKSGFHACENPLDVFGYYPPADSRYCEVEQSGEIDKDSDDSKIASTKIKIGAEIGLSGLIKAGVNFILEHAKSQERNTGNYSAATNTGYQSAATNTGYLSAATNTGNCSAATNTGYKSAATVGKGDSVAIATGYQSKARAGLGSAIVLCERGEWNGSTYPLINIKAAIIDGEKLKADTFYTLKNGEFVEVE